MTAERAGQGEVGGCTWPCLGSAVQRSWSALGGGGGGGISIVLGINGVRK